MPFKKIQDLPSAVREHLPEHAEKIFLKAFNSAWDQYDLPEERRDDASREETAFKVAWAAVKKVYKKNQQTGLWEKKAA
jgi:cation transport regulator